MKLISVGGEFLTDGAALDLSARGARIVIYRATVPKEPFFILDEIDNTIRAAEVIWQRGGKIGLRFTAAPRPATSAEIMRLTGRYYAVAD